MKNVRLKMISLVTMAFFLLELTSFIIPFRAYCYPGSSNPSYDYLYSRNVNVTYASVYSIYLPAGYTVTFSTAKADGYDNIDTVLYLFNSSDTSNGTWVNDDYNGSQYSQITITSNYSWNYKLLVISYSGTPGRCKVLQNGNILDSAAYVGGKRVSCNNLNRSGVLNFFTANLSSGCDTELFVLDNQGRVNTYNDNSTYTGSYTWGLASRVHKNFLSSPSNVIIRATAQNKTGTADLYMKCKDGYSEISDVYLVPNLNANDVIKSGDDSSVYNCIAWSGGITDMWIYPNALCSPWRPCNSILLETGYDCYYGNNPVRYAGADTYDLTYNSSDAEIALYKSGNSWTHAAVKIHAALIPHGYEWESKLGHGIRIFHDEFGLQGSFYGTPYRFYSYYPMSNNTGLTLRESVDLGLTRIYESSLSSDEEKYLREKTKMLSDYEIEFSKLVDQWVCSALNDPTLYYSSCMEPFKQTEEFASIENYLGNIPDGKYLVIEYYLSEDGPFSQTLVYHYLFDFEGADRVAYDIVQTNNMISYKSMSEDVYIAPSERANTIDFIKYLINKEMHK